MKRGGPLRRKTPLKAGKALARGGELLRRTPLATNRKPKASAREKAAMEIWGKQDTGYRRCAQCGRGRVAAISAGTRLQGHHAISKQKLKSVCASRGLDVIAVVWDLRNRVWLCESPCHAEHTNRKRPLPRAQLPAAVFEFASELSLTYALDREYPW